MAFNRSWATDLLKPLAIPSDTTLKKSAVEGEDLKPYWKWEKIFFEGYQEAYHGSSF